MSYTPFRNGIETGSTSKCPHCGVKARNQHSLREAGICDWNRKPKAEKARILAARKRADEEAA